ncbi:MAG: Rne/Rng family ribonuclease, partial [Desulfatiglandales bacterium]
MALLEDGQLVELYIERRKERHLTGNIYKGRVTRVLPGMQAAFIDIGYEKSGFLFVTDMCLDKAPWKGLEGSLLENLLVEEGELELETAEIERPSREVPIDDLLKEGQEIMVQVSKDPVGMKGPRLTCHVSLPGRHLVLMPTMHHIGVSKKIEDLSERQRLKEIVAALRKNNFGYIVRTASEGIEEIKLKKEMEFLLNLWENVKSKMETQRAPSLLYNELSVSLRAVRDLFAMDVDNLTIDSEEEYLNILDFIEKFAPSLKGYVDLYKGDKPLFEAYGIEHEINRALHRKVWLKSGGYIVIEPTEAFTAIDVNTGSFTGKKNLEDTIFKTNMEAAKEIAYQIRLRNIGGIIVVDFIDMESEANRTKLVEAFKELLKKDRAKT